MHRLVCIVAVLIGSFQVISADEFEDVLHWSQLTHKRNLTVGRNIDIVFERELPTSAINESFVSYNNVPMGITHHNGRLFVAVPRRRPGVPATLNVIDLGRLAVTEKSPPLQAYPDYLINQLHIDYHADPKRLVSVYRTKADICNRLWFIDTGMLEYPGNRRQVQRPQLWIIDLVKNRKVRTFEIPASIVKEGIGMASVTIDVNASSCDKAYAYIPDLVHTSLYVYSFESNRMWGFNHSSFQHNPNRTNFYVAGHRFEWDDGIFSIALGALNSTTGARTVFYHPMVSTSEFITSTDVLQNETLSKAGNYQHLFRALGERGPNTQSTMHHFDDQSGVLFYAEVNRNAIGCWNSRNNFTAENHDIIHLSQKHLIYPADLNADVNGTLWILSNKLPTWIYSQLDENQTNFNVWRQEPSVAIRGTKCAN